MADLRTALQEAIEQHRPEDAPIVEKAEPVVQAAEEVVADPRDDKGRFAKVDKVEKVEPVAEVAPVVAEQATKRPSSWKKEFWDNFDKVDPALKTPMEKYIAEREDQFHKGLEGYKSKAQQADELASTIAPYMETFRTLNRPPLAAIGALLATEHALRHGTQEQKLNTINTLIREYKVDINQQQQQFDPNQVNQLVQQQVQETFAAREVNNALNEFMANPPEHFEAVKETMVKLLQSEMASSYKEAYDKATRLHPDILESIQAKQHEETEAKKRAEADKAAKAAKAKAVSVKGTSTGSKAVSGGTDRRSLIADQLREAQSRI